MSNQARSQRQADEDEGLKLVSAEFGNSQQRIKTSFCILKGIIPLTIILLATVTYLSSQVWNLKEEQQRLKKKWDQQMSSIKRQSEEYRSQMDKEQSTKEILINSLRLSESERFYFNKVEKIKDIANSENFLKNNKKARTSFLLSMNNYKLTHHNVFLRRQIDNILKEQYERLSKIYDFSLPEESFCVVVPSINNVQNFRYEFNLRSILNQNYSNFKVVIVDDASPDHNFEIIAQFLKENSFSQEIFLMKNQERESALHNIYKGVTSHCKPEDIALLVDGDDELLGVNILKVFNSLYTTKKLEVLYSNFITLRSYSSVGHGISEPYSEYEKKKNLYRSFHYTRMFPARSFRVRNFLKIRVGDLQDEQGRFFRSASDHAVCTPLLELSCGRNMYLEEYFYLYNTNIGNNDLDVDQELNRYVTNQIRYNKKKYQCQDTEPV